MLKTTSYSRNTTVLCRSIDILINEKASGQSQYQNSEKYLFFYIEERNRTKMSNVLQILFFGYVHTLSYHPLVADVKVFPCFL